MHKAHKQRISYRLHKFDVKCHRHRDHCSNSLTHIQAQEHGEKSLAAQFPARKQTSGWTEHNDQKVFSAKETDWADMRIDYERMRDFGAEAAIDTAAKV
jgi:hypothetical protein